MNAVLKPGFTDYKVRDISLADLRQAGGILPPMYFDELGNLRGGNDELIFAGPNNPK